MAWYVIFGAICFFAGAILMARFFTGKWFVFKITENKIKPVKTP